jgi:hypothetical protein
MKSNSTRRVEEPVFDGHRLSRGSGQAEEEKRRKHSADHAFPYGMANRLVHASGWRQPPTLVAPILLFHESVSYIHSFKSTD